MKKYKFKARIEGGEGGGAYVEFPYDAFQEFGKNRVPFKCTIDNEPYQGTMVKYGTPFHMILVLKAIREKLLKNVGDFVNIVLWEDKEERVVEVPQYLVVLLKKYKLETVFEGMNFTQRKEWVLWLNDAKKEETRLKRLQKVIDQLKDKKSKSGK